MKAIDIAAIRLKNQQLIHPMFDHPLDVVKWMGAMQCQDFAMCRWAIALRMKKPGRKAVEEAFNRGDLLRTHLNRATWQVVAGEDIGWMLLLHGERCARSWNGYSAATGTLLTDHMMESSRELLYNRLSGGHYCTREELMALYRSIDITDARAARHLLAVAEAEGLICSGPIKGNSITYALLDERVPNRPHLLREEALAQLATRYFQSHGPATLADYVWWSGLTAKECRMGMEQMGENLTEVTVKGVTYYLHSHQTKGCTPQGLLSLLPPFDEILIGYKDRTAVLPAQYAHRAHNNSGIFYPVILYNRMIVGNWLRKDLSCDLFHEDCPTGEEIEKAQERLRKYFARQGEKF